MRVVYICVVMSMALSMPAGATSDPITEFLNALNDAQKTRALHTFDDDSREKWHFFPASMWPRPGIPLDELSEYQRGLFNVMLLHSLSAAGYEKANRIIELENVLLELGGDPVMRDAGKYFIAFYGDHQSKDAWGWSFEGHHLSLNFTIVDGKVSMAPRFLGANPATIPEGPRKGERVLSAEEDMGFQLVQMLSADQRQKAIFSQTAPPDIITKNASETEPLEASGVTFDELSEEQQATLTDLITIYLSCMPQDLAVERMQRLRQEDFSRIRFTWAGPLTLDEPHYYRVQGASFLIEFDNFDGNHIHTVWRDFDGDFGRDLLREHYEREHQGSKNEE